MDDLVQWLRDQIADDARRAHWASDTALCEAHTAILDRVVPLVAELEDKVDSEWGSGDPHEGADEVLVKALASAYRHCSGYREEWRP